MTVIPNRLVNQTAAAISTNPSAPTVTPAFKRPHATRSFVAKAGTATDAIVEVQLKVGPTESGPWAIPLDKGGLPVPKLTYSAAKTTIAGPVANDALPEFPFGVLELVNTSQDNPTTWTLSELTLFQDPPEFRP